MPAKSEPLSGQTALAAEPVAGQILSHYRIEARLGSGGMGVVYRATDIALGRAVAIKVLSRQLATSEEAKARFLREARTASALDHPNIGAIYELGEQDGELFIAMALYEGESLKERLARGRLPVSQTVDILRQLASGLDAAHRAGIVHRDIKPANIILTAGGTVKILDFGLAKLVLDAAGQSVTHGQALGTLLYMSPEQLEGRAVDHRTDLWSLGILFYELIAGVSPFSAESNAAIAVRILHEDPPSLATVPGVPASLAQLVARLLRKNAAERFQSASEVISELNRETGGTFAPLKQKSRLPIAVAAIAVLMALAAATVWIARNWAAARRAASSLVAERHARRTVAVLGFRDLSQRPESAWLSTALSEMLTSELAAGERLFLISGESVAQVKRNLNLIDVQTYNAETLSRIRKLLDVDYVVFGSYLSVGADKKLRVDLRLQDAAGGRTHSVSNAGTENDIFDLVSRVGNQLRAQLSVPAASESDAQAVRSSLPSNAEATRLYAEGLGKIRAWDALGARSLLERAIQLAPEHAPAHSALSTVWSELGYDENAKQEAKKAFELSTNLSREEKYAIEARYRSLNNEYNSAVDIYRKLSDFFPDNSEYGLRLAATQVPAGKGKDSLVTVEVLRKLPPPAGDDPRIDLIEMRAAYSISDFKRSQAAAARVREKATELKAPLLVVRGLLGEGTALDLLGEGRKALASFQQAKQIAAASGDKEGVADATVRISLVLGSLGQTAEAQKTIEEALPIRRELGNARGIAEVLNNLGTFVFLQGDPVEAKKSFEEALAILRETRNKRGVAMALGNIANVLTDLDDLEGASEKYGESNAVFHEIGNKWGEAKGLCNLGAVLDKKGDLLAAKEKYEQSLAMTRDLGDKSSRSYCLIGLGNTLMATADLRGARTNYQEAQALAEQSGSKRFKANALSRLGHVFHMEGNFPEARKSEEEALAIRKELGDKKTIAESHISLSELALEEGSAKAAEDLARQAVEESLSDRGAETRAKAQSALAAALLSQGNFSEAQNAVASAVALLANTQSRLKLPIAVTEARVKANLGTPPSAQSALQTLRGVIAQCTKAGLISWQLAARLALGEIEMKLSKSSSARRQLESVEKDAKSKGFELIARKAAAAAGGKPHR